MKKYLVGIVLLAGVSLGAIFSGSAQAADVTPLKFMTYNICMTEPWCSDASPYSISTRKSAIYDRIQASTPDVMAIQEGSYLFNGVTNMAYDVNDEPAPVIDSTKIDPTIGNVSKYFTLTNTGTNYRVAFNPADNFAGIGLYVKPTNVGFTTPRDFRVEQIGTDPVGRQTPRYAMFVKLYDKRTLDEFWVGTTHLSDGSGTAEKAERLSQMANINTMAAALDGPVVLMGDFNEYRTTTTDALKPGWDDGMDLAATVSNKENNSYRGWSSTPQESTATLGQHIDRMLLKGTWVVTRWAMQSNTSALASDHIPMVLQAQP